MAQDKELLLKDLCARMPYGVKVEAKGLLKTIADDYDNRNIINAHVLNGLNLMDGFKTYSIDRMVNIPLFNRKGICNIKPYLFPLSSMTEEQRKELNKCIKQDYQKEYDNFVNNIFNDIMQSTPMPNENVIEFYHKNHIDYRGLITKGLANDATRLNIY